MNYLIFRDDGIGDLIVSTPLLVNIKKKDSNAKIYLICSNRNNKYAEQLKYENLVEDLLIFSNHHSKLKKFLLFFKKYGLINFSELYLLKVNLFNTFLTFFFPRSKKNSLVYRNIRKNGFISHTPPMAVIKTFFTKTELIDNTSNFSNTYKIHMSKHFLNLTGQTHLNKNNYFKLKLKNIHILKKSFNLNNFLKRKKVLLIHLDEKWNDMDHDLDQINELINFIIKNLKYKIIITTGLIKYINETKIKKYFNLLRDEENSSKKIKYFKNNDIILINGIDILQLSKIISKVPVIVTTHGSVTHIASSYQKKIIDLISVQNKFFFRKWKPISKNSIQLNRNSIADIKRGLMKLDKVKIQG